MKPTEQTLVVGINPVREALVASKRHCHKLIIEQGKATPRVQNVIKLAEAKKIPVESLPKALFHKKFQQKVNFQKMNI